MNTNPSISNVELSLPEIVDNLKMRRKVDRIDRWDTFAVEANGDIAIRSVSDDARMPLTSGGLRRLNSALAPGLSRLGPYMCENGLESDYAGLATGLARAKGAKPVLVRAEVFANETEPMARAFLSPSYKMMDDDSLLTAMLPAIDNSGRKFKMIGNRLENRSAFKVVTAEPVFEIESAGKKRPISVGFMVGNSEVGEASLTFQAFLTDRYCDNGIIFSGMYLADLSMRHSGTRASTDFGDLLGDSVKRVETAQAMSLVEAASEKAAGLAHTDMVKSVLERSTSDYVEGDVGKMLKTVCERFKLSEHEHDDVVLHFNGEHPSRFELSAAFTRSAQNVGSYERRLDLEQAGGAILNWGERQWGAVSNLS